jgi:hypothetical protein
VRLVRRVGAFAEDAVDLLPPVRLGQQGGEFGNGLVVELDGAEAARPPQVLAAQAGGRGRRLGVAGVLRFR